MTLALPDEALPADQLDQFDAPFLMLFRAFETMRYAQLGWWRAWCGLLGQLAPLPPELAEKPKS